jgi:hypothetical protein
LICYFFLNVLKVEISGNLRFLRTDAVSVLALSRFCDIASLVFLLLSLGGKDVGLLAWFVTSASKHNPSFGSAARVGKCGDRCDPEDHREDNAAVAINSYRPLLLLGVIEDDGRHNLDEGKENE